MLKMHGANTSANDGLRGMSRRALAMTAVLGAAIGGGGCGGGGSSGQTQPAVSQGVFLNSAVEGLRFETGTLDGFTNADGTFTYRAGESVSFFIGGVELGSAPGAPVLTPIDLVPGATDPQHPTVTNIIRFVQSLDEDNFPGNGIRILSPVFEALQGQSLDFDVPIEDFEAVAGPLVSNLASTYLGGARAMVEAAQAQAHLAQTLAGLDDAGDSPGQPGSLTITGNPSVPASFIPAGDISPTIIPGGISFGIPSTFQGDIIMGLGMSFFSNGQPAGASLSVESPSLFFLYSCAAACSGLVADIDNGEILFQGVVFEAGGAPPITLNGVLSF